MHEEYVNNNRPVFDETSRDGMTYDWLHRDMKIGRPDLNDYQVASMVRMLMRGDLNHEMVCTLGRDRIMGLSKEIARLRIELAAARSAA